MPGIWSYHGRLGGVNDLTDNFMKCLANSRGVVRYFLCLFCACLLLFVAVAFLLLFGIVGLSFSGWDIGRMYCL